MFGVASGPPWDRPHSRKNSKDTAPRPQLLHTSAARRPTTATQAAHRRRANPTTAWSISPARLAPVVRGAASTPSATAVMRQLAAMAAATPALHSSPGGPKAHTSAGAAHAKEAQE